MDKYPSPRLRFKVPRLSFVALAVSASFSFNAHSEMWFDPSFFSDDPHSVADLSHFEKGQEVALVLTVSIFFLTMLLLNPVMSTL